MISNCRDSRYNPVLSVAALAILLSSAAWANPDPGTSVTAEEQPNTVEPQASRERSRERLVANPPQGAASPPRHRLVRSRHDAFFGIGQSASFHEFDQADVPVERPESVGMPGRDNSPSGLGRCTQIRPGLERCTQVRITTFFL